MGCHQIVTLQSLILCALFPLEAPLFQKNFGARADHPLPGIFFSLVLPTKNGFVGNSGLIPLCIVSLKHPFFTALKTPICFLKLLGTPRLGINSSHVIPRSTRQMP